MTIDLATNAVKLVTFRGTALSRHMAEAVKQKEDPHVTLAVKPVTSQGIVPRKVQEVVLGTPVVELDPTRCVTTADNRVTSPEIASLPALVVGLEEPEQEVQVVSAEADRWEAQSVTLAVESAISAEIAPLVHPNALTAAIAVI